MLEENESNNSDQNSVKIAIIMTELANIKIVLGKIETALADQAKQFVTQEQLAPIKMVVYGMVAFIMTAFAGGLVALVWKM